jgi:hypothetical protein
MNAKVVSALQVADPGVFQHAVNPDDLFVLDQPGRTSRIGVTVADFKSYTAFSNAIIAGTISPGVRWVMYDNERWQETPLDEQQNPARYESLFATLAHRHGYKVILTPAQDLVFGLSKPGVRAGAAAWQRYLALDLAAVSARQADIYEIQAQSDESMRYRATAVYPNFVRAAVAQARTANPHITILAGLSTQRVSSATQLDEDFSSTRSTVAGYWLNVPDSDQAGPMTIAEQFLNGPPSAPSCPTGP